MTVWSGQVLRMHSGLSPLFLFFCRLGNAGTEGSRILVPEGSNVNFRELPAGTDLTMRTGATHDTVLHSDGGLSYTVKLTSTSFSHRKSFQRETVHALSYSPLLLMAS